MLKIGKTIVGWGQRDTWEFSVPTTQFFSEAKNILITKLIIYNKYI